MEGTHGQLRTWLADGLGGDDADRVADLDHASRAHVPTVAMLADPVSSFARQRRTQVQLWDFARGANRVAHLLVDDRVAHGHDLARRLVDDVSGQDAARQ